MIFHTVSRQTFQKTQSKTNIIKNWDWCWLSSHPRWDKPEVPWKVIELPFGLFKSSEKLWGYLTSMLCGATHAKLHDNHDYFSWHSTQRPSSEPPSTLVLRNENELWLAYAEAEAFSFFQQQLLYYSISAWEIPISFVNKNRFSYYPHPTHSTRFPKRKKMPENLNFHLGEEKRKPSTRRKYFTAR